LAFFAASASQYSKDPAAHRRRGETRERRGEKKNRRKGKKRRGEASTTALLYFHLDSDQQRETGRKRGGGKRGGVEVYSYRRRRGEGGKPQKSRGGSIYVPSPSREGKRRTQRRGGRGVSNIFFSLHQFNFLQWGRRLQKRKKRNKVFYNYTITHHFPLIKKTKEKKKRGKKGKREGARTSSSSIHLPIIAEPARRQVERGGLEKKGERRKRGGAANTLLSLLPILF